MSCIILSMGRLSSGNLPVFVRIENLGLRGGGRKEEKREEKR